MTPSGSSARYDLEKTKDPAKAKGVDRSGGYFSDKGRAKSGAISSLYVHSEVQAASDAHEQAGKDLAAQVLEHVMDAGRAAKVDKQPLRIVVLSLDWAGYSDPNTVCGGACKGALAHISEILQDEFDAMRQAAKPDLIKEEIYLRGSAQLAYSGHVHSHKEFQGKGAGAKKRHKGGGPITPKHRYVTEYNPY